MELQTAEQLVRSDWGARIRARRRDLGLTQVQVAGLAHMSQATVSDVERGDYSATTPDLIVRLCVALDIEPAKLVPWPHTVTAIAKYDPKGLAS